MTDISASLIYIFEPSDGGNSTPDDLDGNGYLNDDENANGTDPLNAADVPPDNDLDYLSDLLDTDDDNAAVADLVDAFAIDAMNGTDASSPAIAAFEKVDFLSTFGSRDITIRNDATAGQLISSYRIDPSTVFMPDIVFDPVGTIADRSEGLLKTDLGALEVGLTLAPVPAASRWWLRHNRGFLQ